MGVERSRIPHVGVDVTKPVVLIAEELSPATIDALGPDFEIRSCNGEDRAELLSAIADVDALLVRSATKVDAEAIAAARKLKVVARAGVGLDNVDVKAGQWKRSKYTGVELTEKTVGVVGLGRIGMLVANRLAAFGVKLIAYDPYVQPARAAQSGIRMVTLDELLAESDFITVHLPKTPDTVGLIGKDALSKVKPSVRIINAARGGIVDEESLYLALKEGRVAGAGLDVFATEPCTDSPLFELENVVATPHLGASTDEAQEKAGIAVARSVRLALAGELVPDAVNIEGGPIDELVRPGISLTENLGRIAASLAAAPLQALEVEILGEIAEKDVRVLELAALKGVFGQLITEPVSYVNAPLLAAERGVAVSLTTSTDSANWRNMVRLNLALSNGQTVVVGGTVSGPRNLQRLVEVDGFAIDVEMSQHFAFLRYHDRPGIVGVAGRIFGEAGINIGGMQVSRNDVGGEALIALTVDSAIPAEVLNAISVEAEATSARSVNLDL